MQRGGGNNYWQGTQAGGAPVGSQNRHWGRTTRLSSGLLLRLVCCDTLDFALEQEQSITRMPARAARGAAAAAAGQ